MTEYYNNLLKTAKNPEHISYYKEMITFLQTPQEKREVENVKDRELRRRRKKSQIYVGSLNKTFKNKRDASVALGYSITYIYKVVYGHIPNKYDIEEI